MTPQGLSPMDLWSEPFAPAGGIGAKGIKDALGRPSLELSTLLMRETIQNSWDAKDPHAAGPLLFGVHLLQLSQESVTLLRRLMFHELRPVPSLRRVLDSGEVWGLFIYDRGTIGLAGPTWADVAGKGPQNFINFVRNVGQGAAEGSGTAGTYGYGKSVLYRASDASTIIVHSRCRQGMKTESRLIAAALGDPFDSGGKRYTGRHWWGLLDKKRGVDPLRGPIADRWADELEMPSHDGNALGTTILVLAPTLGDPSRALVESMASSAAWHCWPKMVRLGKGPDMAFKFTFQDEDVAVPDPNTDRELKRYVAALKDALAARRGNPSASAEVFRIESYRPIKSLGTLAIRKYAALALDDEAGVRPYHGPSRHVALMRHPKLVVKYLEGPVSPVPGTAWAGIFISDDDSEVERAFAASEPPSHDDWSYATLPPKSRDRSYVRVALNRITEVLAGLFKLGPLAPDPNGAPPLAHLADALGGLIAYESGTGTTSIGAPHGSGGGLSPGQRRPTWRHGVLEVEGDSEIVEADGMSVLRVPFKVTISAGGESADVEAAPGVAINDGGQVEREPPIDAAQPQVVAWELAGQILLGSDPLHIMGEGTHHCAVRVSLPADIAVAVELKLKSS